MKRIFNCACIRRTSYYKQMLIYPMHEQQGLQYLVVCQSVNMSVCLFPRFLSKDKTRSSTYKWLQDSSKKITRFPPAFQFAQISKISTSNTGGSHIALGPSTTHLEQWAEPLTNEHKPQWCLSSLPDTSTNPFYQQLPRRNLRLGLLCAGIIAVYPNLCPAERQIYPPTAHYPK